MIEIDGVSIPIRNIGRLTAKQSVVLVLPMGRHVVRFGRSDEPRVIESKSWFVEAYREAAVQVQSGGRWDFDRLLDQSRQALDRFTEPLVPHFWGNYYWQEREYEAAARHYEWALEIAPSFAPAYFNLAALQLQRGDRAMANRYIRLAELWNSQNAYGLGQALSGLRAELGEFELDSDDELIDWYMPERDELTARDRDMMAVLRSSAEFAPRFAERAKILNNLGAYFEYAGKPVEAMQSYRSAAAVLGSAALNPEERRVIQGILENLARLCRNANMPEYKRYERLQAMIR
jgi:tetratricopeptide (TPR) repeat protein